jgi:hypothetical protein
MTPSCTAYRNAEDVEASVRWLLASPDPAGVPRPNVDRRIAMLDQALGANAAH